MRKSYVVLALLTAAQVTISCENSTAPGTSGIVLTPMSSRQIVTAQGDFITDLPKIRVSSEADGTALPGVKISFTLYTPTGTSATQVVTADANGVAQLASWRIGNKPGLYRVDALAGNSQVVGFRAYAPGTVVERYYSKPSANSAAGDRPSLMLTDDGAYFWGDDFSRYPDGQFTRVDGGTYRFFIDALNPEARWFVGSQFRMYDGSARNDTLTLVRTNDIMGDFPPIVLFRRASNASATVSEDQIIESYEVETIGGRPLPQTYSGGGASWVVTGARYDLLADSTYYFYYIGVPWEQSARSRPAGYYSRTAQGTIEFYTSGPVSQFYIDRNRHFATGTLNGSTMTVHYDDPVDFEEEVYTRRK